MPVFFRMRKSDHRVYRLVADGKYDISDINIFNEDSIDDSGKERFFTRNYKSYILYGSLSSIRKSNRDC